MSYPKDIILYNIVKEKIYKKYPKHSAYRSGILVQQYTKSYEKKYNSKKAYKGKKNSEGLKRWFKEEWKNQRNEVGYKKEGDIYRPTKRVNKNTPKLFTELSSNEIKKAMKEKKETGRVKKFYK